MSKSKSSAKTGLALLLVGVIFVSAVATPVAGRYGGEAVSEALDIFDEADTYTELDSAKSRGSITYTTGNKSSTARITTFDSQPLYYESQSQLSTPANWTDLYATDNIRTIQGMDESGYLALESGVSSGFVQDMDLAYSTHGKWSIVANPTGYNGGSGQVVWWFLDNADKNSNSGNAEHRGYRLVLTDSDTSDSQATAKVIYRASDETESTLINETVDSGEAEYTIKRHKTATGEDKIILFKDGKDIATATRDDGFPFENIHKGPRGTLLSLDGDARVGKLRYPGLNKLNASTTFSAGGSDIEGAYVDVDAPAGSQFDATVYARNESDSSWTKLGGMATEYATDQGRIQLVLAEDDSLNASTNTVTYALDKQYDEYKVEVSAVGDGSGDLAVNRVGLLYEQPSTSGGFGGLGSGGSSAWIAGAVIALLVIAGKRGDGQ